MKYRKRLFEDKLRRLGAHFPVILLTGARQVGKSTLLEHLLPQAKRIVFDPIIDVANARKDPELFLDHLTFPVILDEIQYAPELLPVIKRRVDQNKTPGQYWLTGSQNLSLLANVAESLAGRAGILSLYPMTFSERYINASAWIIDYLQDPHAFLKSVTSFNRVWHNETLASVIWKGGYPGVIDVDNEILSDVLDSYWKTYIERDVRLIAEVSDLQEFSRFTQLAANLTAQEIQFTQLGREIGISHQTAQRWLNILKSTYQWSELQAYSGNTIKRVSGKAKGYFMDTAMSAYQMHISSPNALLSHPKLGALFETYVVNDIQRQLTMIQGKPALYHWRSHGGAEVDLIIEMDNVYHLIEIKCKTRPVKSDLRGIQAFRETYPDLNYAPSLLICATSEVMPLSNDCFAMPYDL